MTTTTTPTVPDGVDPHAWARIAVPDGDRWRIDERDAGGEVVGTAYRDADGGKDFEAGGKRGLIYDPRILVSAYAGASSDDPILICEGATDTAAAGGLGFDAVGLPMAQPSRACLDDLCAILKKRDAYVCVMLDADDAGRKGARTVAAAVAGVCRVARIAHPPDEHNDLRTWVSAGATREDVLSAWERAERAQTVGSALRTVRLADVEPERLRWLWPGRIPLGKLTLLYGDPGLGKSFLTMDLAARVSTGAGWPDLPGERFDPGGVILLTAEDGLADTVRPRLDAAGADVSRIEAIESVGIAGGGERAVNLADDLRLIEERIAQRGDVRLFIIDPVSAYCGKADSHTNAEVRGMLAPIAKLAERHGVAIVAVSHLNKGAGGRAMYRAMGSLAFIAAARAGWLVVEDENDPTKRLLLPTKMNLAARPTGMAFSLRDSTGTLGEVPSVAWDAEPVDLSADDALAAIAGNGGDDGGKGSRDEAEEWLADVLALGPLPAKEIKGRADDDGIAERTLNRAKKQLGVVSERTGFDDGAWCWRLPKVANSTVDCPSKSMATYGKVGNLRSESDGSPATPDPEPDPGPTRNIDRLAFAAAVHAPDRAVAVPAEWRAGGAP